MKWNWREGLFLEAIAFLTIVMVIALGALGLLPK